MRLRVTDVHEDPELQLRDGLDMDRVKAMEEFEEQGGHLPPITVVGEDNLLADGHHRLYVAMTTDKMEIEAERVPGGKAEAVVIAMMRNDSSLTLPLTSEQTGKGVKLLLEMGWTQAAIAKATGVARSTVTNIAAVLTMRGDVNIDIKPNPKASNAKAHAVLPAEVHEKLDDTVLVRIGSLDSVEEQAEMAAAVAEVGLPEPRVREAVKAVKAGMSVRDAIEEYTPSGGPIPKTLSDVTTQAYRRIDRFLSEPMTVMDVERDFWQVLDVLVANRDAISTPALGTLASRLAEVAVRCDQYASALQTPELVEAVS